MPVYEYACEKCQHEFEAEQRITDDPLKTCPSCRSRKVKRLISRTSFVLKGGGWYSDLYASPGGKDKAPADEKSDKGGAEKSDAKSSETKDTKKSEKPEKSAATQDSKKKSSVKKAS